jgi:hypothetical protein
MFYGHTVTNASHPHLFRNVGNYLSIVGPPTWYFCWTNWHWDRFFSQYFSFPLSLPFHQCPIPLHSSIADVIQSWRLTASLNNTFQRTASYSRRLESSSPLLWKPRAAHRMRFLHAMCQCQVEFNYDSHSSFITSLLHHLFIRNLFALFH